jgi:hypothetical protein
MYISLKGEETLMDKSLCDRRKVARRTMKCRRRTPGGCVATRRKQADKKMECNSTGGMGGRSGDIKGHRNGNPL